MLDLFQSRPILACSSVLRVDPCRGRALGLVVLHPESRNPRLFSSFLVSYHPMHLAERHALRWITTHLVDLVRHRPLELLLIGDRREGKRQYLGSQLRRLEAVA